MYIINYAAGVFVYRKNFVCPNIALILSFQLYDTK